VRVGGAEDEQILLSKLDIRHCRHCEGYPGGTCRIEDDFAQVVDKVRIADAAVFISPVYFTGYSDYLRAFLHLLREICRNETGREGIAGKRIVSICIGKGASCCSKHLERILAECGFALCDRVCTTGEDRRRTGEELEAAGEKFAMSLTLEESREKAG
jgi:multimeric flavodoxin WrbA